MAWAHSGGASNADGGAVVNTNTLTATNSAAVAVGDTVCVGTTFSSGFSATSGVVTDQLGNTYTKKATATDTPNDQIIEVWESVITHAGTPTVQLQFNPTPGTSQTGSVSLCVDSFTGSDAASGADGAGSANLQATPGTGADGIVTGTWATTVDGDLIYTVTNSDATGNNDQSPGTGFTAGQTSAFVVLSSAWKVQTTHSASTQATWTATVNNSHLSAALAVTPAGTGAASNVIIERRHRNK